MAPGLTFLLTVALAAAEPEPAPTAPAEDAASAPAETAPDAAEPAEGSPEGDAAEVAEPPAEVAEPPTEGEPGEDADGEAEGEDGGATIAPTAPVAPYDANAPEDEVAPMLAEPEPAPKSSEEKNEDAPKPRSGIGLMAAGGATIAVGGTMLGVGLGLRSTALAQIAVVQNSDNPDDFENFIAQAEFRARNGLIVGIVGGVVAAAGIPLLATGIVRYRKYKLRRVSHLQHVTPRLAFDRQGATAGVHMRF